MCSLIWIWLYIPGPPLRTSSDWKKAMTHLHGSRFLWLRSNGKLLSFPRKNLKTVLTTNDHIYKIGLGLLSASLAQFATRVWWAQIKQGKWLWPGGLDRKQVKSQSILMSTWLSVPRFGIRGRRFCSRYFFFFVGSGHDFDELLPGGLLRGCNCPGPKDHFVDYRRKRLSDT